MRDSGANILHRAGNRAFYRPSTDTITLPLREQFPTADNYYATALHELGHWSGHNSRLNRDLAQPFGSEIYAKEELRAEIASMMLGEQLSIGHDPSQHVAYIGSWVKALQEDPREIFKASSDAERIVQFLRGREMQQIPEQAQEPVIQITIPVLTEEDSAAMVPERVYLDVPYSEKNEAKALGACWDREAKSWYVGPSAEPELLERWAKGHGDNVTLQQASDPQTEFATALRSAGFVIDSAPVMDGELRRVRVEGDGHSERNGAYVGFSDGHPAGFIQNYKTGFTSNWKASQKANVLSARDRARLDAEAAEKRALRSKEREAVAVQTAQLVAEHWIAGDLANEHPYLAEKGVQAYGLRINTLGPLTLNGGKADEAPQHWGQVGDLMIPVYDANGELWAVQSIDASGRKSFPRGSKLQGGHFVIGEPGDSDVLLIAEGYATAATLHELSGMPVAMAFHSGNLPAVAEALREKYPDKILILAGDDDHNKPKDKNVGRQKAEEAAKMVGGYTMFPRFEKDAPGSDWNDLMNSKGNEHTKLLLDIGIGRVRAEHTVRLQALDRELEKKEIQKLSRLETHIGLAQAGERTIAL